MQVFDHPEFDSHERILFGSDPGSGMRAIIAIHDRTLGPGVGGCRVQAYPGEAEAVTDCLRLSRAMTYKSALAEIPLGGAKMVVLADPARDKSPGLLRAVGRMVEDLGGQYVTAEDAGMTAPDLHAVAEATRHVVGIREEAPSPGRRHRATISASTAYGVFTGVRTAVRHRLGADGLSGVRVALQGLGSAGWKLGEHLHAAGARLWVSDVDRDRVAQAAAAWGAEAVDPAAIHAQPVDVFAPCALGAVLNDATIPELRCSVVAGAANNQLARAEHGEALRRRGILYAPDYAINAGGIIEVAYEISGDTDPERLRAHLERIGATLRQVFERAEAEDRATDTVADQLAEERLRAGRA
ncbi:MAG: Leu/Phe/Val dehydrogenase [Halorhodospira sp.]